MKAENREMIELFRRELVLCGVGPGVRVAVLSEGAILRDYAEAFMAAGRDLGSEIEDINLGGDQAMSAGERIAQLGTSALTGDAAAMDSLKQSDLVVDLMLLLFSKEQVELQESGVRMLLAVEPFEVLKRLFPTTETRARVEAGERRLAGAEQLRFTNGAGTDVTYTLGSRPILTEYGYTDTPGRWDHWPSGFLATVAVPGGVEGRVVMDRGDILLPQMKRLEAPVEFTVERGRVTGIRGGKEASELRKYIEAYGDPRAYDVSHIGWGLNERAEWTVDRPGIGMDSRAHYGNVLFSLGPDIEFGGSNDTPCHLDLPMKGCTLTLDEEVIVEDGRIVPKEMQAPQA
jgi:2,5-dihydroxypyridine 5,6-dioxygenase